MWGDLHEEKEIIVNLSSRISAGTGNRYFRELGATLYTDVYAFDAPDYENWQSETLLQMELYLAGEEVDAHEDFDEIHISYLLASRPSSDQSKVLWLVSKIIKKFDGSGTYKNKPFSPELVQEDWDACNEYLLKEWGEEPGSMGLARMIDENYA